MGLELRLLQSLVLVALLFVSATAAADAGGVRRAVVEGWIFFEAGNLRMAEESFKKAASLDGGKENAELQYGLSLIPWKRGLARQAYWQLKTALAVSGDGADDEEWRHRIKGRIRYIERNFSAVTMRLPARGKALPMLLDPVPRDPVLRQFSDAARTLVEQGSQAADGALRLFVPSGRYWVGDKELELNPGEVQPGQQQIVYLPVASGPVLRRYRDRLRAQQQLARAPAEASGQRAASVSGGGSGSAQEPPTSVAAAPSPVNIDVVRSYLAERSASELTERWTAIPFHLRYSIYCPDGDTEHRFEFPDYDFYVRFEPGAELRVKGEELLRVRLGSDWQTGDSGRLNEVELMFDGTELLLVVNGMEFGPVRVREKAPSSPGRWRLGLSDDKARISWLSVRPLR